MTDEWDEWADGWDDDPAARAYAAAAFESLVEVVADGGPALAGARVLDFGCGTGLLTERLVEAGASVVAVDTSPAMLAVLDAKAAERGWTGVVTGLAVPDDVGPFELVVASSVCSFLDDYRATVGELAWRLGPGGVWTQWDWERTDGEELGFTTDEIREALIAAGLGGVEVRTAFSVEVTMEGETVTMAPLLGTGRRAADAG
ncbi:MAG: class I SAM-dependent methyltransferase [Actinomycetota bacterium]